MSTFANTLATVWVSGLWQGALLVLLGAALLPLLPRAAAAFRHAVLVALFALTLLLPWLSLHPGPTTGHALRLSPWVAFGIAACWCLGFSFRAVTLFIAWQHLRSVRQSAIPFPVELADLRINTQRQPCICTSSAVDSPLIVGFFRPVLLLPQWLAPNLRAEELRQIVLHECEHLRRSDDWSNLGLHLALTLFPLNPALLWFNRRIGVQRELACDAAVVAVTTRPIDYAASLARIAEQRLRRNTLRLALAAWGRQSELSTRVHALLEQPLAWSRRQTSLAGSTVAALLFASVVVLVHVPQLVRIEAPSPMIATVASVAASPATAVVPAAYKEIAPAHLLPASYRPKSATPPLHTTSHRSARRPKPTLQPVAYESIATQPSERMDTTTVEAVGFQLEAPGHATHARLTPTYLAVPVASGWILIPL